MKLKRSSPAKGRRNQSAISDRINARANHSPNREQGRVVGYLVIFLTVMIFFATAQAAEVRVAVAANFLATLKVLTPIYEKESGDRLIVSAASTGKLYAQIVNSAPFDLFLSADRYHVEALVGLNKAVAETRFIYAQGQLVLWSRQPQRFDKHSLDAVGVKRIAVANSRTAPYGAAAQQTLKKLDWRPSQKTKLVYGESVGQAFQFVASGNAQLGFVALSQLLNPKNPFNQPDHWLVPQTYYQPLAQEAVLLQRAQGSEAAKRFLVFLKSAAARELIRRYGYL